MSKNYNEIWKAQRQQAAPVQAGVLCTFADIYFPYGNEAKKIFSFQKRQSDYTLIEDAAEVELEWMESKTGSPFGVIWQQTNKGTFMVTYNELLGVKNFFDPTTLHVGRLTDAALDIMEQAGFLNLVDQLQYNPYVLYRPSKWQWAVDDQPIIAPEPNPDQKKRRNIILLGLATSALMNM